jgi:flagellar M-ring protein FliF
MDFLNQASAQLANLFRSMSVGARIMAGLLLLIIVVSLAYLFNHQFAGPDAYLMGGAAIEPEEMNAIMGALGKAGLKNFVADGGRIRIPRGEEAAYMAALVDQGVVPGGYGSYLQKAATEGGMLVSKARQAQLTKVAIQRELQRVIRHMDGINNAFVIYEVQEDRRLNAKKEYSASVSVGTTGGSPLDDTKVTAIRHLVASAIGMPPEKVTITDLDSGFTYPATKGGQPGIGFQDPYIQNKITYEKIISENIRAGLVHVPGVVVACTVELKDQLEHEQHKTQHDPKTVTVALDEETKTLNSQGPQTAGPPGLASQGGVPPNQPAVARGGAGGAKTDEEVSRSTVRSVTSVDEQRIKLAALTPSRVTAAIAVPSSYLEQVWLERNPPPPGEASKKPTYKDLTAIKEEKVKEIQEHVAQLIPLPNVAAPNPIPLVKVTVFDKLPGEQASEPGVSDHVLGWLGDHWSTLGTGMLGLVSLVMLRSMVRSSPAAESLPAAIPPAIEREETHDATPSSEPKQTAASRLKRREKGGPSLREELVEIVREDPDAAANVLRSWINSGA